MKYMITLLAVLIAACPVACVNDPTQDDSTCLETATDSCVTFEMSDTETATEE